jgi:hypothetical protein
MNHTKKLGALYAVSSSCTFSDTRRIGNVMLSDANIIWYGNCARHKYA